jgi:hypothetical protein
MSCPHAVSDTPASYHAATNCSTDADLKKYNIDTAAGADLTKSVGPSAEFLQMPIAFNYK